MDYIVLVPIDEVTLGSAALRQAVELAAGRPGVAVVGLHVVNVIPADEGSALQALLAQEPSPVPADVAAWCRAQGEALLARFTEVCTAAGARHQARLEVGAWADRVLHHGQSADLVVLNRPTAADEPAPGEGADYFDDVISGLRGAVAVIPPGAEPARRLLLGWSESGASQRALRAASRLARATGLPLEVLAVHDPDQPVPERQDVLQHAVLLGLEVELRVAPGVPWEALTAAAAAGGPTLIVVGASDKSRWGRRLWGSTTDSLLDQTDMSVLVVG
ncbi:MAG: hypothetical protein RL071_228 [Pseudomonadota bacterium]